MNGWSPALAASYGGHIDVLRLLINHFDPSQGDDDSVTSLHVASYKGHINIAQYLVNECHVDPDRADSSYNTPLLYSALGGQVDLVTFFLKKCNVSQVNREGSSLSLLACMSGRVALVQQLKQFGLFSADDLDYNGRGIVHYCAMSDSVELLEYLQNNYVVIFDDKDRYGITPLHIASQYASSAIIMRMISVYGYKVLLDTDYSGHSSLHYLCSGLIESHCVTEVYNKLFVPSDMLAFSKFQSFDTDSGIRKALSKFLTLNVNVSKQHDRVSLLSRLLKKTSSCHNFNINSITATGQSLLHLACTSGSTLLVKVLEEYGINTSSLDYDGRSAVHYAALSGSPTLLSYTVSQYSLNASQPDYKGVVPLALACMSGSINAVEYLINTTDIDIDITCDEGRTPLHYSCRHGNLGLSQYLIEVQGSDININDNIGCNALTNSATSGEVELVQYLIKKNCLLLTSFCSLLAVLSTKLPLVKILINACKLDPHFKASDGEPAVHYAAQVGAIDVLEYLIKDCRCDMSTVGGKYNSNVFHLSAWNGHYSLIKYIIDHYPQYTSLLHSTDVYNALPIHRACASGIIQLVTFLIDVMKCDITTENKSGYTCVSSACQSGNLDLVQLLIKTYKLNPRISGKGTLSLTVSVIYGNVHILEWLRQEYRINVAMFQKGLLPFLAAQNNRLYCLKHLLNNYSFDINATDSFDHTQPTVLHLACQEGHVATVLYLTSLPKCDISAKTSNGSTALHLACKSRSLPILKPSGGVSYGSYYWRLQWNGSSSCSL